MNSGRGAKYIDSKCPRCGKKWKKRCKYEYTGRRHPAPFFCPGCAKIAEDTLEIPQHAGRDGRTGPAPGLS